MKNITKKYFYMYKVKNHIPLKFKIKKFLRLFKKL